MRELQDGDRKRRTRFNTLLGHDAAVTQTFVDCSCATQTRQQSKIAAKVPLNDSFISLVTHYSALPCIPTPEQNRHKVITAVDQLRLCFRLHLYKPYPLAYINKMLVM